MASEPSSADGGGVGQQPERERPTASHALRSLDAEQAEPCGEHPRRQVAQRQPAAARRLVAAFTTGQAS